MNDKKKGVLAAILCGIVTVMGFVLFPANKPVALFVVVIFPFLLCLILTKSFIVSFIMVWLNELIFGSSGTWITIGPIPGRGMLLILVLLIVFANQKSFRYLREPVRKFHQIVIFYGVGFPLALLLWGVLVKGADFQNAVGDILRFAGVLGIYPFYRFIRTHYVLAKAWLLTAVTLLSVFFIIGSIGPEEVKRTLVDNWVYLGGQVEKKINYIRLSYETLIYGYIGLFYGLNLITNPRYSSRIGGYMVLINLATSIINFLRGPLLAITLSTIFFFFTVGMSSDAFKRLRKIIPATILVTMMSIFFISSNDIAKKKMGDLQNAQAVEDIVSSARVEQSQIMIQVWQTAPIMGLGVGSPLPGYSRGSGLSAEVQYLMVLYRIGVVGLLIVVLPFFVVFKLLIQQKISNRLSEFELDLLNIQKSIGLALVTLGIASFFNPYLASSVTITFFVMFFGFNELSKNHWKSSGTKSRVEYSR